MMGIAKPMMTTGIDAITDPIRLRR